MSKVKMMQNQPKIGEIIVPGPARNSGIRSFILTGANHDGHSTEMIFGLLAAEAPKRIVDKLVDRLIDEIRPAFFSSGQDAEARYEHSLKQANRAILAFLHEHHLSLSGIKLRGTMAALSGESLFVTNRGSLRGVLVMKKNERAITVPLFTEGSDTSTNPKFFSSFQQGVMPPGAVFIAGTKELFSSVDDSFLKRVFTERSSEDAGREIRKGLSDKPNVAALTLSIPEDAPATTPVTERIAPSLPAPKPRRRRSSDVSGALDIADVGAKSIRKLLDLIVRYLKLIPKALVKGFAMLLLAFRLLVKLPHAVRILFSKEKRETLLTDVKGAPKQVARLGLHRFNALPNKSKAHLLLLIAVSAIFLHGILYSFQKHSEALAAKSYEAKLAEIGQLQTDLETSIIIGNDRRSYDAIAHLDELILSLPEETSSEMDTKNELSANVQTQRDKIRRYVTITDPEILASYSDPEHLYTGGAFTWFDRALYLFSPSGRSVKSFGLDGSISEEDIETPSPIRDVAPARTGILLVLEDGTIAYWKPGEEEVIVYPEISVGDSPILFYQGRLYSVRPDGMLERRQILDGALGATTEVLQAPSDLKAPRSIGADGAAYLLSASGELRKYLKGIEVNGFRSPTIDPTPQDARDLWADANSRWIVFLERKEDRIIMIDSATGRLAAQLVSDTFGDIATMTIDPDGNFAYLVAGERIISVPLKGPGIN